jgi:hypothetical protein
MHYKYFLDRLISRDLPFSWHQVWKRSLADPSMAFTYPYFHQTTKPARKSLTLSAELLKARCLNDLVDIWHGLMKSYRISDVHIALKLSARGKGRGPRAFKTDRLQMAADTEDVMKDIVYDETTVAAMITRAADYWAGNRPPEHGPILGIYDCRFIY